MRRSVLFGLACLSFAPFLSAVVLANRVFVSARSGNDANNCASVLTPCQTFAGAVTQLNPAGEAIVLDSGGYGPVSITQSLTIEAPPGVTAFIHPPSGDAITINAGASDVVTLRGLLVNGGSGNGIVINSVGTLTVRNCSVPGMANDGILEAAPGSKLNIEATDITGCFFGVLIANSSGTVRTTVDLCHLDGNIVGLKNNPDGPSAASRVSITRSTASNNTSAGFFSSDLNGGLDELNVEDCVASHNGIGVESTTGNSGARVRVSNCQVADNVEGLKNSGLGALLTRGNNTIEGNGTDEVGTIGSYNGR